MWRIRWTTPSWGHLCNSGTPVESLLFIDASHSGHMVSRAQHALSNQDLRKIRKILTRWRSGASIDAYETAAAAELHRVRIAGYNLNPAAYLAPPPASAAGVEWSLQRMLAELEDIARKTSESHRAATLAANDGSAMPGLSPDTRWTALQLGDICRITPGAATKDSPDGTIPVVKPRNVVSGRIVGPTDHIDADQALQRSTYRIQPGDILCTRTGTVGKIALASSAEDGWIFGTGLIRIRIRPDTGQQVDPLFLSIYLAHSSAREALREFLIR